MTTLLHLAMNLEKTKRKLVEEFVASALKEYGRKKIDRMFAARLLIRALDALEEAFIKDIKAKIYDWPRSTLAGYSGVDDLVVREVVANQMVELIIAKKEEK